MADALAEYARHGLDADRVRQLRLMETPDVVYGSIDGGDGCGRQRRLGGDEFGIADAKFTGIGPVELPGQFAQGDIAVAADAFDDGAGVGIAGLRIDLEPELVLPSPELFDPEAARRALRHSHRRLWLRR